MYNYNENGKNPMPLILIFLCIFGFFYLLYLMTCDYDNKIKKENPIVITEEFNLSKYISEEKNNKNIDFISYQDSEKKSNFNISEPLFIKNNLYFTKKPLERVIGNFYKDNSRVITIIYDQLVTINKLREYEKKNKDFLVWAQKNVEGFQPKYTNIKNFRSDFQRDEYIKSVFSLVKIQENFQQTKRTNEDIKNLKVELERHKVRFNQLNKDLNNQFYVII